MPFPTKALQYGQLIFKTAGLAVPTSGHEVFRVAFLDADGEKKTGFYKPLGPTYPALLAKFSVAYGVFMRMSSGKQVAEDRLVLDKEGRILGTLSYALPGFMPLLCFWETLPSDEQEKLLRCPSEEILLYYNFTDMLVADYCSDNNDAHPGNVGIARDECGLIMMSEDPETISDDKLKALLNKKQAYVLYGSKVYYIDSNLNKKILDTTAFKKLKKLFPNENNQLQKALKENLIKITSDFQQLEAIFSEENNQLPEALKENLIKITSEFQQLKAIFPNKNNQLLEASEEDLIKIRSLTRHRVPYFPVLIDHDMRGSKITSIIKGLRLTAGIIEEIPANVVKKSSDCRDFPLLRGITHWPANTMPGNLNILKRFMAYAEFQGLAKNPVLKTKTGTISYQDQLFHSFLKHLVLYDPDMLKSWLFDYLGDFPLDFLSLEPIKSQQLSEAYPALFNTETDSRPFVDCISGYFQLEYNEFYAAVVFFTGCEENSVGVPVIGTSQYLQNKPSAYRDIDAWTQEQNKLMEESWTKNEVRKALKEINAPDADVAAEKASAPLSWFCIAPENRYDAAKLQRRYHQIWRDSHLYMIKEIIFVSDLLVNKLSNELRIKPLPFLANQPEWNTDDQNISGSWQLLEDRTESRVVSLDCDDNNGMHAGLMALNDFINGLYLCSKTYYSKKKDHTNLTVEDNDVFCNTVSKLIRHYAKNICKKLSPTRWANEFAKIVSDLQQCYGRFNIQLHLLEKDVDLKTEARHDYPTILQRKHTVPELMTAAIKVLFDWAKKEDKDILDGYILEIMTLYYEPSFINFTANRDRGEEVKRYLKTSMESGDNKLGHILGETDSGQASTSLNTLLIKHLMPIVLKNTIARVDVNLMSVSQAFEAKEFNDIFYTKHAVEYARTNSRFTHSYSLNSSNHFNGIIYRWVHELNKHAFKQLITLALKDYEPYSFNFFSGKTRGADVRKYLETPQLSNQQVLAFIFSDGDIKESSLNTLLLKRILEAMRAKISTDRKARLDPDFKWIMEANLNKVNQFNHYLNSLQHYAKDKSHALAADLQSPPALNVTLDSSKEVSF